MHKSAVGSCGIIEGANNFVSSIILLLPLCGGGAWLEKQNRWLNLPSWLRYTIIMIVKGFHTLKDKLTGGGTSISISSRHKSYFTTSWWYIYSSAFLNMGKKWNVHMIVQYVSLKSCPGQKLVCYEKVDLPSFGLSTGMCWEVLKVGSAYWTDLGTYP